MHDHTQFACARYDTSAAAQGRSATDLSGLAAKFDTNHDGVFDAQDAQFADFTVWKEANQNGVSGAGEVKSLAELGLASFNLSSALTVDGQQVLVADVGFEFTPLTGSANDVVDIELASWTKTDTVVAVGGETYKVYNATQAGAQLLIDQHIVNPGHVL